MAAGFFGISTDDDTGLGILLRRHGTQEKRSFNPQFELHYDQLDQLTVDTLWL